METTINHQQVSCYQCAPYLVDMSCAIPIKAISDAPTAKGIIYTAFKDFSDCMSKAT